MERPAFAPRIDLISSEIVRRKRGSLGTTQEQGRWIQLFKLAEKHKAEQEARQQQRSEAEAMIGRELNSLWQGMQVLAPSVVYAEWQPPVPGVKRRRVRRSSLPEGMRCTF